MKKLKDILKESNVQIGKVYSNPYAKSFVKEEEEERPQAEELTTEQKHAFLEAVKQYKKYGEAVYRNAGLGEVYESIKNMVEMAGKVTISETDDWFDNVTVSRHMKRMGESFKVFEKTLKEVSTLQQRLEASYDEIGEVLGKYYEINETEEVEEGNEFGAARAKAIANGDDSFEVDGKKYPVKDVDKDDKENAKEFTKESMKLTDMISVNEASNVPKFKKGQKVYYTPRLSGFNPKTKLEIIRVVYEDGDNFTSSGWYYSFKNSHLRAHERDIKLAESVNESMKLTDMISVNEVASRTAMEIGGLTGMNKDAIQKFVDDNNLDIEKVYQYVKKSKLPARMDFVTAIAGKPNNPIQQKMIKMFGESVNEASQEFVVYVEKDNGRKKLLHTKQSQRAANMFLTKNADKILNQSGIRTIGSMSKFHWEKDEEQYAENIKKADMKTVTKKEWDSKHKDYKGMIKGQPYMMYMDKNGATVYGPVNIKESVVNEAVKEVVLSNRILNFLEERGVIKASDSQKIHKDLTAFLKKNLNESIVNEAKYDIGMARKGNGITVYNRAEEEKGDYKNIAHISDNGTVKYFDKKLPNDVKKKIEAEAQKMKESIKESHFKVGDKVEMSHGGIGVIKSLDKEDGADDEKYYNVELPNGDIMKHAPNELKLAESVNEGTKMIKLKDLLNESFGFGELPSSKLMKMKVPAKQMLKEGTRSQVGYIDSNGNIKSAYVHFDGYPENMKPGIKKHMKSEKDVMTLIKRGGARGIFDDKDIEYYDDKSAKPMSGNLEDIGKYIKDSDSKGGAEFVYLYNTKDKKWYFADTYKDKELKKLY